MFGTSYSREWDEQGPMWRPTGPSLWVTLKVQTHQQCGEPQKCLEQVTLRDRFCRPFSGEWIHSGTSGGREIS